MNGYRNSAFSARSLATLVTAARRRRSLVIRPPRYGRFIVSREKGPRLNEQALAQNKKFTWFRSSDQVKETAGNWGSSSYQAGELVVNARMKHLSITAGEGSSAQLSPKANIAPPPARDVLIREEGELTELVEPVAKRPRTENTVNVSPDAGQ
ncbi:unnamed protein product [Linum trigynum]|uniref:Uncharacterized protein n=1 Tax=Linum trigynum TaxID=586398 RepID=A0AAV2FS63_9ROSI